MSASDVDYHKKVFGYMTVPIILYSFIAGIAAALYGFQAKEWTWFSWHPFCMMIAFVCIAGNAALIKKIGGYSNTKLHGNLMFVGAIIAGFGWYVIYRSKEMRGKQHLTSTHGQLGFAVLVGNIGLFLFAFAALHPDWGVLRTNKLIRFVHKWGGRSIITASWVTCVLGFLPMQQDLTYRVLFAAPMVIGGLFILL